jgi:hypothetical protein
MHLLGYFIAGALGISLSGTISTAQDLGETVAEPGVFSYQAPQGWTVKDTAISKHKVCFDTPKNKFAANINVVVDAYPKSLAEYVELNKTTLKNTPLFQNLQVLDQQPFETSAGDKGIRVVVSDSMSRLDLEQVFYFFDGASNSKLVVTASCLVGDADHYLPIFDATLKTFSPK